MQFLMGLSDTYSTVRGSILMMNPLPDTCKVHGLVLQHERQLEVTSMHDNLVTPYAMQTGRSSVVATPSTAHNIEAIQSTVQPTAITKTTPVDSPTFTTEEYNELLTMLRNKKGNSQPLAHATGIITPTCNIAQHDPHSMLYWIVDSGATDHISHSAPTHNQTATHHEFVSLPNGEQTAIRNIGSMHLAPDLTLDGVLHDVDTKKTIGLGKHFDGLYYLTPTQNPHLATHVRRTSMLWHQRLGHPSSTPLHSLSKTIPEIMFHSEQICDVCPLAKQTRLPFTSSSIKTVAPFDLIHCDIWGPHNTRTHSGARYFLTIVDDFTRFTWVHLMNFKSDTQTILKSFFSWVTTQFNRPIKTLRSDNGSEFLSMRPFFLDHGTNFQHSCTYTPQQNGVVERKHRHLLNIGHALRFQANLPLQFWGDSLQTACYLINRLPTPLLSHKTPYERLHGKSPVYSHLRVFGCLCYATHLNPTHKFDTRARRCLFLGYPLRQKGYCVFDLETKKYFVSRDVIFHEHSFPFSHSPSSPPTDQPILPTPPTTSDLLFLPGPMSPGPHSPHLPPLGPAHFDQQISHSDTLPNPTSPISTLPLPSLDGDSGSPIPDLTSLSTDQPSSSLEPSQPHPPPPDSSSLPRRSVRVPRLPSYLRDYEAHHTALLMPGVASSSTSGTRYPLHRYVSYSGLSPAYRNYVCNISRLVEPSSYEQACHDPHWVAAMNSELQALEDNHTWSLVPLPPGHRPIGSKWIFRIKYHSDGSVDCYKARLVAQGFNQREGIDFTDTFAPVAKLITVRYLLTVAAARKWSLHQMDVQNAFLHGDLHEEVYMLPPPSSRRQGEQQVVCRLHKSLYGLKQAPRSWFRKFSSTICGIGFKQSRADYSLFTQVHGSSLTIILLYVDDMIITGNDEDVICKLKHFLGNQFRIKDLGPLKYFLGVEVARSKTGISICQRKYTLDILEEAGLLGAKPAKVPMDPDITLSSTGELLKDPTRYRRLVGKLIYLTITRPEITYAVNTLSQFMQEPKRQHLDAVNRLLHYLKGVPGQGLLFSTQNKLNLIGYCDANWARCPMTRRSVTG
ncbi:unnamed protein product [Prunus armeniaca]